ncbi:hypothetical protein JEM67_00380 (plasmid) [Serratia sp. PAMC26656]|uniref:hypothetical protein n=1 Tax=Serratia sp. PAMC26656 TaxID=2775909 RepID=UPI0018F61F43|nr:hypothetical protein [Serratia sp. PAMC26656]MBJ7889452.1 hypothetical protein [Serratia sp. PAMC26656]
MSDRTELTHEVRVRMTFVAKAALANRGKSTPEAKEVIKDYLDAISPQTVLALLEENERLRALVADLIDGQNQPSV